MNLEISRRQFIKGCAIAGAAMALPLKFGVRSAHAFYQSPGLRKWQTTLRGVGPGQIPVAAPDLFPAPVTGLTHFTINVNQFTDQLHPALGPTTIWGYDPVMKLGGGVQPQKHIGAIVVANKGTPYQLTFRNNLPNKHIIPVDTTLPGANAAQNRLSVHLHGGHVPWISDGGPFDWWAPNGTHGQSFLNNVVLNPSAALNEAEYFYPNDQTARLMWYHDHAFGITRLNAYAGIATGYIIRDTFEAGLVGPGGLPAFIENGGAELPIVIQDKVFVGPNIATADPTWVSKGFPKTPGSLWYPHLYEKNRWRLLGAGSRLPNPSVVAEMFGDTMLANGTVYPTIQVEAKRYRFRILNVCNARFLNLQLLVADPANPDGITITGGVAQNPAGPDWTIIGTEGGFLPAPVTIPSKGAFGFNLTTGAPTGCLFVGSAERWDVIVDFKNFAGQTIVMYTDAPAPFPFGDPRNDYYFGNPTNPVGPAQAGYGPDTRQILRFVVGAPPTVAEPPLSLPPDWTAGIDPLLATQDGAGGYTLANGVVVAQTRQLTLNEDFDAYGRLVQMIGTNVPSQTPNPGKYGRALLHTPTETPLNNTVEIWEVANLTGDTHPIHFHLNDVQILWRRPFDPTTYAGTPNYIGPAYSPAPEERGWKETVRMNPGEVTAVIVKFNLPAVPFVVPSSPRTGGNEYVYHCHILEHEEHDMMRPLVVT